VPSISEISAKELLYAKNGSLEEKPEVAAMYAKTHGNIASGVQKKRNYDWQLDPTAHVFGYGE